MSHIKRNILIKVGILMLIALNAIGICTVVSAVTVTTPIDVPKYIDPDASRILPERNAGGASGLLPQYWGLASSNPYREVTLDDSRLLWKTAGWSATISNGSVAYCAMYNKPVRYGRWDPKQYYLYPDGISIQEAEVPMQGHTIQQQIDAMCTYLKAFYTHINGPFKKYSNPGNSESGGSGDQVDSSVSISYKCSFSDTSAIGFMITPNLSIFPGIEYPYDYQSAEIAKKVAEIQSQNNLENIFNAMSVYCTGGKFSTPTDPPEGWEPNITATEGPVVAVLENEKHASDGYKKDKSIAFSNDAKAFIFSASEDAYNNDPDYASKYSLNDIQGAYWKILADEGGPQPTEHVTEMAEKLYERAKEYEQFLQEGFSASIDDKEAQVIADRQNKQYIIGPYSLNYQNYEDICYVKSLTIDDKDNLVYDDNNSGIKLVLDGEGTARPGSNGIQKEYPKPGQKFFVVFSAREAGMPANVQLNVRFEHIQDTSASGESYIAEAHAYRYNGYCLVDGDEYAMEKATVTFQASVVVSKSSYTTINHTYNCATRWGLDCDCGAPTVTHWDNYTRYFDPWTFEIYIPYIKMNEDYYSEVKAQELHLIGSGEAGASGEAYRNYVVETKNTKIDLTMELGGNVWEDSKTGKETQLNGNMDGEEKRIPNVKVTLYLNGSEIASTKTDSNGSYRFSNLNAMYTYYVKFTYNGQYYQPTIFSSSSTWGQGDWTTNSNATDVKNERNDFNAKFASIGSAPANYNGSAGYNETFSKERLLGYTLQSDGSYAKTREAIIDEFGNLIKENGSDEEERKMIQYVKDCMMDAYTGDGNGGYEEYPVPAIFLIDNAYTWRKTPTLLMSKGIAGISILYDSAYYINLGLDQREQFDMALRKDVEKVTVEINGQSHVYTYDTLDTFRCKNCNYKGKNEDIVLEGNTLKCPECGSSDIEQIWDIGIRLSDGYYNTNYSRELYKSDYLYKASNYGNAETLEKLRKIKGRRIRNICNL